MNERFLDVSDIEKICYEFAKTELGFNEPLPPFGTRFPGKLEAALSAPQRTFGEAFVYATFERRAAVLFYEMCKGQHPFVNGNKRMALVALLTHLALNEKWLLMTMEGVYELAIRVATSAPAEREQILLDIERLLKQHIQPFSQQATAA